MACFSFIPSLRPAWGTGAGGGAYKGIVPTDLQPEATTRLPGFAGLVCSLPNRQCAHCKEAYQAMTLVDTPPAPAGLVRSLDSDPPVTVYISRKVRPGCESQFETVMRELLRAACDAPGHMGASVFRPTDAAHPEYRVVFKFDRMSTLQAWEDSPERHDYLARMEDLLVAPSHRTHVTGLEAWFTLPGQEAPRLPSRHRVALVTWLGVYLVGLIFAVTLNPRIALLPVLLRVLIHSSLFVPIMLYGVLPRLTRLFRRFLYPDERIIG